MNNEKIKTIRISAKHHRVLKVEAAIKNCPIQDVAEDVIELWMKEKGKEFIQESEHE